MDDPQITYLSDSGPVFFSALTIDVEDGINISMRDNFGIEMKPTEHVLDNVEIILDLCQKNNVKATFFILGEVAESFPDLIKKIDSLGHEIGIHGYQHDQLFRLTPPVLRKNLLKTKDLIENLIGKRIIGFRAPAFSVNAQTSWALEIIAESGFTYDSSIVPAKMGRYGWDGFGKQIVRLELPGGFKIIEVPLPIVNILGHKIPACGGGYLRYFPLFFTHWAFSSIQKHQPVVVYLHPYELDTRKYPDYFYSAKKNLSINKSLPLLIYRFRKSTVKKKLDSVMKSYKYKPLKEIIDTLDKRNDIKTIKLKDLSSF